MREFSIGLPNSWVFSCLNDLLWSKRRIRTSFFWWKLIKKRKSISLKGKFDTLATLTSVTRKKKGKKDPSYYNISDYDSEKVTVTEKVYQTIQKITMTIFGLSNDLTFFLWTDTLLVTWTDEFLKSTGSRLQ